MDQQNNQGVKGSFSFQQPIFISAILFFILFIGLILIFIRSEQRFAQVKEEVRTLGQRSETEALTSSSGGPTSTNGSGEEPLQLIGATFGPVPGDIIFNKIQLDWKDTAKVRELRILNDNGATLIAISGKSDAVSVPHPYIVGALPDGFVVKEGRSFETLVVGKTYRVELKGRVDEEPFEVGFDFNIPKIL